MLFVSSAGIMYVLVIWWGSSLMAACLRECLPTLSPPSTSKFRATISWFSKSLRLIEHSRLSSPVWVIRLLRDRHHSLHPPPERPSFPGVRTWHQCHTNRLPATGIVFELVPVGTQDVRRKHGTEWSGRQNIDDGRCRIASGRGHKSLWI